MMASNRDHNDGARQGDRVRRTRLSGSAVGPLFVERDFSVRVASRHPERTGVLFPGPRLGIESIYADINDDRSVADALAEIGSAVNAVSLYAESGQQTFHSVHVTAAARVARLAREGAIERLIKFLALARIPNPPRPIFAAAVREKGLSARRFPPRRSSALP